MKTNAESIKIPVLVVSFSIILHVWIEQILTKIIVDPVLSDIQFSGNVAMQAAYFILVLIIAIEAFKKISKRYKFSDNWLIWSTAIAIIYLYYRIDGSVWQFEAIFSNDNIKAADILLLFPVFFCLCRILSKEPPVSKGDPRRGFLHDDAKVISASDDTHDRNRFLSQLKDRIINTPIGEGSFCIGVIGQWGSGKTTFLRGLKQEMSKTDNVIELTFDPWIKAESRNLSEAFFNEFSLKLSTETDLISSDIEKYARLLVKNSNSNLLSSIIQYLFPSINFSASSLEQLKGDISNALEKIAKKVIVYIDDVDRLDQDEIIEVLRLIRNAAAFKNVFYIVAFDKVQVENSLKDKFELGHDKYLEKIFQVEFYLTPIKKQAILDELISEIKKRIDNDEKVIVDKMFAGTQMWTAINYSWIGNYLNHHRDVVRYLNQFDLHYEFVEKEVFLPDFIAILILRLKYPAFYYHLYRNRFDILTLGDSPSAIFTDRGELFLATNPGTSGSKDTILSEMLQKGMPEIGIEPGDTEPLEILSKIFDIAGTIGHFSSGSNLRSEKKGHLSIIYSQYFSRYFDYSFAGQLSDVEFEDAVNGPKEKLLEKIDKWCENSEVGKEVIDSLERIVDYPDIDTFDKVFSSLIYISNKTFNGKVYSINNGKILDRIDISRRRTKETLIRIFGNMEECRTFLKGVFQSTITAGNRSYILISKASEDKEGTYPLSILDLNTLTYETCKRYFQLNRPVDSNFRSYALDYIRHGKLVGDFSVASQIHAYLQLHMEDSINLFMGVCERHADEGAYKLYSDWIEAFFDSHDAFISWIEEYSTDYGKELRDFISVVKSHAPRDCSRYEFKILPIPPAVVESR